MKKQIQHIMKRTTQLALLVCFAAFTSHTYAAPGLKLGKPTFAGNGCPAGSASTVLSQDKKTLAIMFGNYTAEAGINNKRIARAKCDLAIPLTIPKGYRVQLFDADYRGFVELPKGAKATLTRNYFFSGRMGTTLKTIWRGKKSLEYYQKDKLAIVSKNKGWSKCGAKSVILRTKSSLLVKTKNQKQATVGLDSIDITRKNKKRKNKKRSKKRAAWNFHLKYKRCR